MLILFVADPLESFQVYKDSTFTMMREAQRRGHRLLACEPRDLRWVAGGRVTARVREIALTEGAPAEAERQRRRTGRRRRLVPHSGRPRCLRAARG
jgi:glutathione synthase